MMEKRMGRWIVNIITVSLLSLLLITAYVEAAERQVVIEIEGMTCELCPVAIKKSMEGIKGVKTVKVSFEDKKAWVTAEETITDDMLLTAVQKTGPYTGKVIERKPADR
ncbi:MAG: heavy metal-associated domain-containing protein [Nitrospiraceae bacterium]|nr:heavy metal-associated domain-containing protein [Nitrospiraceae bacterium]